VEIWYNLYNLYCFDKAKGCSGNHMKEKCPYCGSTNLWVPVDYLFVSWRGKKEGGSFTIRTGERPTWCEDCKTELDFVDWNSEYDYDEYYTIHEEKDLKNFLRILGFWPYREETPVMILGWKQQVPTVEKFRLYEKFEVTFPGIWNLELTRFFSGDEKTAQQEQKELWEQIVRDLPYLDPMDITDIEGGEILDGVVGIFRTQKGDVVIKRLFGKDITCRLECKILERLI